jgi:hypothetical protein
MTAPLSSWCKQLRWKDYERDRASIDLAAFAFADGQELYTCLRTAQEVGWDDGLVHPSACGEHRACYEEHPLLQITKRTLA